MQTTVNPEAPQGDQPTTLFPNSAQANSAKAKSASADAASISTQSNPIAETIAGPIAGPQPHTPDQDLELFGRWVEKPIWVPPKDNNDDLAKSMLNRFSPFATKDKCWKHVTKEHRDKFTQVRAIELPKACLLYTSPSPRDQRGSRMPSSA